MLRLAKIRHPKVVFHHADICNWVPSKNMRSYRLWDSIWHVPLENQESVIGKLLEHLEVNGVIIFTSGAVDEKGMVATHFGPRLIPCSSWYSSNFKVIGKSQLRVSALGKR